MREGRVFALSLAMFLLVATVHSAAATTLASDSLPATISAPTIWNPNLAKGSVFYVPFSLTNGGHVYAWQLNATWDPDVLSLVNFTLGVHWTAGRNIQAYYLNSAGGSLLYATSFLGWGSGPLLQPGSTLMVSLGFKILRNNAQTRIHIVTISEDPMGFVTHIYASADPNTWHCIDYVCPGSPYRTVDGYFGNVHAYEQTLPQH